jgi:multimeric flavodoxin WrbA
VTQAKKIVAIVGSYRKGATIDSAVSEILTAAAECGAETTKIYLTDAQIAFCTNCRSCTQEPGSEPAACATHDEMDDVVRQIEESDALVLASPVNFFDVTAVTKRFQERLLRYVYWPWSKMTPSLRKKTKTKKAVLVTSSAAPAILGRTMMRPLRTLKQMATILGAKKVGTLYIGLAAKKKAKLPERAVSKARALGRKLAS